MYDQGIVIEVKNDTASGAASDTVIVQMKRSSACSSCGACKAWGDTELHVEARNEVQAVLHDRVRITTDSGLFLQALAILYGIPFVAMMAGFFVGTRLGVLFGLGEYAALCGFGAGFAMAYLCYRIIKAREPKRKGRHKAVVSEVIK